MENDMRTLLSIPAWLDRVGMPLVLAAAIVTMLAAAAG
jgi:hypothetical protein